MSLQIITNNQQFSNLGPAWNALTQKPLQSFEWHYSWWQNFSEGRALRIYTFELGGQVVGIAPFYVDSWLGQSKMRFIASGSTCTDYADIICQPRFKRDFIASIAHDLTKNTSVSILELEGISASEHANIDSDLQNYPARRYDSALEPSWILSIPESWEQFLKSSKKSLRRKAKKAKKRLDSEQVIVRSTLDGFDLDEGFDILVKLHQERFQSKGHPGVFADPSFTQFLYEAISSLAVTGRAEILIGFHGSQPIAANVYLLDETCIQFYQAGIASEFMSLEPGHVMLTYSVQRAIDRQKQHLDFLRGDEPYKPYWGAVPHELKTIQLVSRDFVPTAVNRTYRAVKKVKQVFDSFSVLAASKAH